MTRLAAIDVGTNSVRLYVAEVGGRTVTSVDRDLVITRLGQGVDVAGTLAPEAVRRTLDAIAGYAARAGAAGANRIRIAATSAVRDAADRDAFLDTVETATGIRPEVLTGDEEAAMSFLGATSELDGSMSTLVLDIGGGSTEFVTGRREPERWISIDVGSVRLTERHVRSDPPAEAEVDAVRADADAAVRRAREVVGDEARALVGVAGTITTIAAVSLGLPGYDRDVIHHARLSIDEVGRVDLLLRGMTTAERRGLPAMPSGREDVIVAGSTILLRVMHGFGFEEVLVSEADILDGLVLDLLRESGER